MENVTYLLKCNIFLIFSVNVNEGELQDKHLNSGRYVTCDIFCFNCKTYIGWKYVINSNYLK